MKEQTCACKGETLNFDRKVNCDWCGCTEICAVTHYGTTNYNRLICVECCMSINQQQQCAFGITPFNLNNSTIRFNNFVYDITKEEEEELQ